MEPGAAHAARAAVYLDADACPVKAEAYRVAARHGLAVTVVSNAWIEVPRSRAISLVVVGADSDAADDWIVEHAVAGDIVVTDDVPLAARCVRKRACVLTPRGRILTEDSIGSAVATRDLLTTLRSVGETTRGPAPFSERDRSQFLQSLESLATRRRT